MLNWAESGHHHYRAALVAIASSSTPVSAPVPHGIFAIGDGMGLVAKRIEHEPNSDPAMMVIKSVNPEYQTYQRMAEEVHIIGRVVWTSRRL
jgi:hypothetical protein